MPEEIYSEETHEIINTPPKWIIRWGATLILLLITCLFLISVFIQYPDVVSGSVVVETKEPLLEIESKTNGIITAITVEDNSQVRKGDVLLEIENNIDSNSILYIKDITQKFQNFLANPNADLDYILDTSIVLGEIQNEYNSFVQNYYNYTFLVKNSVYDSKILSVQKQLESFKNIYKITQKQLEYSQKDYDLQKSIFESEKELYAKGASTKYDMINAETKFISIESNLEGLKKQSIEYTMSINDFSKQIMDLKMEKEQKYRTLIYAIHSSIIAMQNYLNNWSKNFQVIAPINGTIYFRKALFLHQELNPEDLLFSILPNASEMYAKIGLRDVNLTKVGVGQKVKVKLIEYPYEEYGYIEGRVSNLSTMPKDSLYEVIVDLPNKLMTTYNKSIPFKPMLKGKAEIITKNKSVFDRVIEKLRKIIDK